MCIKQDDILRKNYEDIREIFKESSERELLSYPVLTDFEASETIQNMDKGMDFDTVLINNYFLELTN